MNRFRLASLLLLCVVNIFCLAQPIGFRVDEQKVKNCVPFIEIPTNLYEDIIDDNGRKNGRAPTSINRDANYTIPVVFHIIHKDSIGNISDEQVYNALDLLNQDFNANNPDIIGVPDTFKNIIGNANVTFKLAQQAPNGSCSNGINRYLSPYSEKWDFYWTDDGQYFLDEIRSTYYWDVDKYLNIYVVNYSENSGISAFPYQVEARLNGKKWLDGIMIRHYNLGNIETAIDNALPHVLAHEAGHYFNLLHAWGNWWYPGSSELDWYIDCNQQNENCPDFYCSSDDLVKDTPNCKGFNNYICPAELLNTCVDEENDLPDNTQNIMDYSCMIMFTEGQVQRMHEALNSNTAKRNNLWSEENLNYTLNCTNTVAAQPCYQIYSSYIRGLDVVQNNYGYIMTSAYDTQIKARYKINDGDWIELPETDKYYFPIQNIEKCAAYQIQISEKCGDIFSPWTTNRFFYTNGEDVQFTSTNKFTTTIEKQDETAFNANDASITINAINGTPPYTFSWSTGDTTNALTNIMPGKYYVTVSDSSGCSVTDAIVIEKLYCDSLEVTVNYTNQKYNNTADGNIEIVANGGPLPYTYLWSNGNTNSQIDSLLPGEYWFVLADSFQCQITDTIKIDAVDCSTLNTTFTSSDETDFKAFDGFIEAQVNGGTPPYNFYWSENDTTALISNLTVGDYVLTTTDLIGCQVFDTITVKAAYCNNLAIDILTTNLSYRNANDATALATPFGGKPPYTFNWSTGDTLPLTNNLKAGTYSLQVFDSNLCETTVIFDINLYNCDNFNVNFNTSYINYLNSNDGAIQITSHNGYDPLQILWSTGETNDGIDNLYAGDYWVEIKDSLGCVFTDTLVVSNVDCDTLQLNITTVNQTYVNYNDGSISIDVEKGVMPYNINWSTGDNQFQLNNLSPGEYSFYFEDDMGCVVIDTIFIEPIVCDTFNLAISFVEESYVGANDAEATATTINGVPPFQYYWSTLNTLPSINGLTTGDYVLNVTDGVGCQVSDTVLIRNSYCDNLAIDILTTNLSTRNSNDATAIALASGGKAPYKFLWSTGDTLASIANLNAGIYTLQIVDSNLCETEMIFDIYQYDCDNFNINFNISYIDYLNSNDGAIQITSHNGFDPLQILWATGDTIDRINNLYAGEYWVEVIDSTGCVFSDTLYVSNVDCDSLQLNIATTNQTYYNQNGGSISIEVENGIMPYTINWSTGDSLLQLNNLSPGEYSFYFEDNAGCIAIDTIFILPIICNNFDIEAEFDVESYVGANDAKANVSVFNGTAPLSYYWSNGETKSDIYNLEPAIYSVAVYDANGCYAQDTITINALQCNINYQVEVTDESYYDANDGTATIIINKQKTPYTFYWSTGDTLPNIKNLPPNVYYLTISDKNGCAVSDSIIINERDCSQFSANVLIENATCSGNNNGSIQLTNFENAIEPVQYFWNKDTLLTNNFLTNLSSGFYLFDAIDSYGCSINSAFRVTNETQILIETIITPESWQDNSDGSIATIVTGGTAPYNYKWSTEETTETINNVSSGLFTVAVTDATGCSAIATNLLVEILAECLESSMITDTVNLNSKTYKVKNFIESNATINTGEQVIFKAGNFIYLNNGFEVPKGAEFSITIEDCE